MYLRQPVVLLARLSSVSLSPLVMLQHTKNIVLPDSRAERHEIRPVCEKLLKHTHLTHTHTRVVFKCNVLSIICELVCDWSDLCLSEHIRAESAPLTRDVLRKLGGDVDLQGGGGGGSDETADDDGDLPLNHDIITVRMTQILTHTHTHRISCES